MLPLISICVPAYKEPELLRRCLGSIVKQDYKNIEVIVTDDTPDEQVKIVCNRFEGDIAIHYFQNIPSLGSPANWNSALDKANGEFHLLLHHDDWLMTENSLSQFLRPLLDNPSLDGVFGSTEALTANGAWETQRVDTKVLHQHPENLLLNNKIGPPSNLMIRATLKNRYNVSYKWLVDIDYYLQILNEGRCLFYVPQKLVGVGIHANQTTGIFKENPMLVVKENILFAQAYHHLFSNWRIYDHYWRLVRNLGIDQTKIEALGLSFENVPKFLQDIILIQKTYPSQILSFGPISKILMLYAYSKNGF